MHPDPVQHAALRSHDEQAAAPPVAAPPTLSLELAIALEDVASEVLRAIQLHGPMTSAHEAYAVIDEAHLEFRAEVYKREDTRNQGAMRNELVHEAAMCLRALVDLNLVCGRGTQISAEQHHARFRRMKRLAQSDPH